MTCRRCRTELRKCFGMEYDERIDVWSYGLVLLELCLGRAFFDATTKETILVQITTRLAKLPINKYERGRYYHDLTGGGGDPLGSFKSVDGF